jgi:flavin-dependent dehydrogenase
VTVRSIVRDGDGYCLEVERKRRREFVRARQVVAACGRHSQLDRCLDNGRRRGDSAYVAFKYHATGVDCGDVVELHGFPGGYCGLSEVETGHVNVCAIVERDAFRAAGATVNAVQVGPMAGSAALRRHLASLRADGTPLTVGYIPFEVRGPVAGQVPLVGDAAAAIAPLCGDGIAMALRAGELLAPLLVAMLQGSLEREQMCRHYTSAWRGEFRRRLALGRLLQWLLMRSGAATVGLRAANALPWLARRLVLWTRGEIRDAVSPLQWDSVDGIGVP